MKAFGYDAKTKSLIVEFHSGEVFSYANVSPKQQSDMKAAESIGKWFAVHIRSQAKKHPFKRLK